MNKLKNMAIMAVVVPICIWGVSITLVLVASFVMWVWIFDPMWAEMLRFTVVLSFIGAALGALIGDD